MFGVLRSIAAQNTGGLCKYEQQICIVSPAKSADPMRQDPSICTANSVRTADIRCRSSAFALAGSPLSSRSASAKATQRRSNGYAQDEAKRFGRALLMPRCCPGLRRCLNSAGRRTKCPDRVRMGGSDPRCPSWRKCLEPRVRPPRQRTR